LRACMLKSWEVSLWRDRLLNGVWFLTRALEFLALWIQPDWAWSSDSFIGSKERRSAYLRSSHFSKVRISGSLRPCPTFAFMAWCLPEKCKY
jgi:hypothetical protein